MASARRLPLYEPGAQPSSWNQRMAPGEYAVHYSSFPADSQSAPYCDIVSSRKEAEAYAREAVAERSDVRCRVYDAHGMVGSPLFEVAGKDFKGEMNLSRFRRWAGGICFVVGSILTLIDVLQDYRLMWPSTIGTRMLVPGAILLVTEGLVMLTVWHNAKKSSAA